MSINDDEVNTSLVTSVKCSGRLRATSSTNWLVHVESAEGISTDTVASL